MPTSNGIDPVRHPAIRNTAGTGYIILSREIGKEEYISACFRNSTVTIITDDNEIIKNVAVDQNLWNYLEFPNTATERGSCVVWLNISKKNKPIIIATVNRRDQFNVVQTGNSFKLFRSNTTTSAMVEGLGDRGIVNVVVEGSDTGEGELNVRISNKNGEGLLDVLVQGEILIEGEKSANIKLKNALRIKFVNEEEDGATQANISYELGKGFVLDDEFGNKVSTSKDGISAEDAADNKVNTHSGGIDFEVKRHNKIKHKGGENLEPALLGDKTNDALDAIMDALSSIQSCLQKTAAANMAGPTAPVGSAMTPGAVEALAKITLAKQKIKFIKSKTVEVS